jgi:hypothetical protein
VNDEPVLDTSVAHPARVYNYLLGGKDNYAADRRVAERTVDLLPGLVAGVRANRRFVLQAVRYAASERGIDQFVDLGAGVPTSPAVHDVARAINPAVRVAYVDNDPIVVSHDRALLGNDSQVVVTANDLTDPTSVLDDPEIAHLIDWERPVGLIAAAVFHFIPDDQEVRQILAAYRDRLAPGSALIVSMATSEGRTPSQVLQVETAYATSMPFRLRSAAQLADFLDGLELAEPGIVDVVDWRPDPAAVRQGEGMAMAAVGHVPVRG